MKKIVSGRDNFTGVLLYFSLILSILMLPVIVNAGSGDIISGPYSLTIRGGGQNDSASMGVDVRADYLNPLLNLHVFGTYDQLDGGSSIGEVKNNRYGAGIAISHTYLGKANAFIGTSFINELDETFGHAYVGGKLKVSDNALLSGTYGFGFGDEKKIIRNNSWLFLAESADWLKLGGVLVANNGLKANLYYYLTGPGDENISGLDGEISYPVTEAVIVGLRGSADLSDKEDIDKNWQSYLFLTYSFGSQKGSRIDVALDKNNPVEYPRIIRRNKARTVAAVSTLAISPASTSAYGCSTDTVTFTASGGTPPYSWSSNGSSSNLTVISSTQAEWFDTSDDFCSSGGTVIVTLTDSAGDSVTATINVLLPE
jgi:hypothetical protein